MRTSAFLLVLAAAVACGSERDDASARDAAMAADAGDDFATLDLSSPPTVGPCAGWLCPDHPVTALLTLSDGALLAAGTFDSASALYTGGLSRTGAAGHTSPLAAVVTSFLGAVYYVEQEHGLSGVITGKYLVAGSMSKLAGAVIPRGLMRLNADGTQDMTFNAGGTGCTGGVVLGLLAEHDTAGSLTGRLLVHGACSQYNGNAVPLGLFRVFADGGLDASYNPGGAGFGPSASVRSLIEERAPDGSYTGKTLVAGSFATYNGVAIPRALARLDATGAVDTTYNSGGAGGDPGTVGFALALELSASGLPTGNVFAGFSNGSMYNGAAAPDGLCKLAANGTRVPGFAPALGLDRRTTAVLIERGLDDVPTGKLFVAGALPAPQKGSIVARIDGTTGATDSSFNVMAKSFVADGTPSAPTIGQLLQERDPTTGLPTGRLLTGSGADRWDTTRAPRGLARLDAAGTLDASYLAQAPAFDGAVYKLAYERDGAGALTGDLLIAGPITFSQARKGAGLARISVDGILDPQYPSCGTSGFEYGGQARALVEEHTASGSSSGRVFIGGRFSRFCGGDVSNLVRLTADGSIDPSFRAGAPTTGPFADGEVDTIVEELGTDGKPTGKILVGGSFASYDGASPTKHLVRLLANGALDSTFNGAGVGFDTPVQRIVQEHLPSGQPSGKLLISSGVLWNTYNGVAVSRGVARLLADGAPDASFNTGQAGFNNGVWSVLLERDTNDLPTGRLIATGAFTMYDGAAVPRGVVRLLSDGALDTTFHPAGAGIDGIAAQDALQERGANGKPTGMLLVRGLIASYDGTMVPYGIVRLDASGALDPTYNAAMLGFDSNNGVSSWTYAPATASHPLPLLIVGGTIGSYNALPYRYWLCLEPDGKPNATCGPSDVRVL